jgi:hypothetical protein
LFCTNKNDIALESNGLKIMILLRLSPLIPNHALDYISGVTSISIQDYWISLFGIMPSVIAFCYIGATASSLNEGKDQANHIQTIMLLAGLFFALIGAILAAYYAKKELDTLLLLDHQQHSSPLEHNIISHDANENNNILVEIPLHHHYHHHHHPREGIPPALQQQPTSNRYHLFI